MSEVVTLSPAEVAEIQEIRRAIDRWRRMLDDVDGANRNERDAILYEVDSEMGHVLHTKCANRRWWMP